MQIIILIILILVSALLTQKKLLTENHMRWANSWIIWLALPSIALLNIPSLKISAQLLAPILSPILGFIGSFLFFYVLLRRFLEPKQRLVLAVSGALGNTSFIGFPVISSLYAQDYMPIAIVIDQINFLLMASIAYALIVSQNTTFHPWQSVKKIITFPSFIALVIALFIEPDFYHEGMVMLLEFLSASMSPVAMLIIGFYFAKYVRLSIPKPVALGILYSLVLAPILTFGLLELLAITEQSIRTTSVIEAAMPPMTTIAILFSSHDIKPRLAAQLLCWGIAGSFITLPIWYFILA